MVAPMPTGSVCICAQKGGVCVFCVCVHVCVVCMLVNVFECCGTCLRSVVSCVSQDHIEPSKFVPPSRPMRLTV